MPTALDDLPPSPDEKSSAAGRLAWQLASLKHVGIQRRPQGEPWRTSATVGMHEVLFLILASASRLSLLHAIEQTWCGVHHPGATCEAYLDNELEDFAVRSGAHYSKPLRRINLVPASAYLLPEHRHYGDCCTGGPKATRAPWWRGGGPLELFCGAHVNATLPSQYRFLPALAHARSAHGSAFRAGRLKWLVLVDDDSWVSVPKLLGALGQVSPAHPVQMGDFVDSRRNATHWVRRGGPSHGLAPLSEPNTILSLDYRCAPLPAAARARSSRAPRLLRQTLARARRASAAHACRATG